MSTLLLALGGCGTGNGGVSTPVITPAGGTYSYIPVLSIQEATPGAVLYYTTDGSTPSASSSSVYSSSTYLKISQNETVNVIAVAGSKTSPMASAQYTINLPPAPTPVLSTAPGAYFGAQTVTATDTAPGATIYYTADGSTPTSSSNVYSGPISVASSETLQFAAISQSYGYSYSAIAGGAYTILDSPVFSVTAGTYTSAQTLSISDATAGASIYYTTNGSVPTTSSTLYTGPITVGSTEMVSAIAAVPQGSGSLTTPVVSADYIVHLPGTSLVLSGTAVGDSPVVGASVQLYEVGTAGYASAATPLLSPALTTDSTGAISLTGKYTCTPGSYLYLTASGGTAVSGQAANPNLTLAATVGLCDNLNADSSFTLNEQTTVAAAYALAQFSAGTSFGTSQLSNPGSGSSAPADNFATSSTNSVGLANAMAIGQILASNSTGALGNNANSSAVPEWWQMNLISDMLAACVRSTGGDANDGSACGTLFGNVTAKGGAAPTDTLQAALDLALAPTVSSSHITNLYSLVSSNSPFLPYPPTASSIYDFSMAINYVPASASGSNLLHQPQAVAIDSMGNAWIGNQPTTSPYPASLVELTPTGVPIQAGASSGTYAINSYTLSGQSSPTVLGGQYVPSTTTPITYSAEGLFAPSIDTNNNVWITDRENSNLVMISGSGTTFSNSYSYQNGGSSSATGYELPATSEPTSVYLDGSNNVWFTMEGPATTTQPGSCLAGNSLATFENGTTPVNAGLAAFLGEDPENVVAGKTSNAVSNSQLGYITVDPGKNDTITVSGSKTTISGSPFVWVLGNNAQVNLLLPYFSQTASSSLTLNNGIPYAGCMTNDQAIGQGDDTAAGDTYFNNSTNTDFYDSADPGYTLHANSWVLDIPNPATPGDFFHDIGLAQDWTWDNAGNLWVADGSKNYSSGATFQETINTAGTINYALSKITPSWGTASATACATCSGGAYYVPPSQSTTSGVPTTNPPSNFTFSIFHGQSGLFDSAPQANPASMYITTDGSGNVYFTTYKNYYLNAMTNSGTALTQVSGTASSPTTGFIGSICTNCVYNGAKAATYQRSSTLTLSRPTIDQAGNIWVPIQGSGSNSIYLLVGAAVPRVQPDSVGLKNGTFASMP